MSEHKYLMSEYLVPRDEWKYRLDVVYQRDIDKQELAALRAELKAAQEQFTASLARLREENALANRAREFMKPELDRMRKALEDAKQCIDPFRYDVSFIDRALNQQPAQYKTPETPWRPSSLYNGYEERINGNGHLEMRPQPAQQEKP